MTDEHGEGNMETTTDLAIRKTIHVDASPERAFEVFTRRIGSWWPLETHALHPGEVRDRFRANYVRRGRACPR